MNNRFLSTARSLPYSLLLEGHSFRPVLTKEYEDFESKFYDCLSLSYDDVLDYRGGVQRTGVMKKTKEILSVKSIMNFYDETNRIFIL